MAFPSRVREHPRRQPVTNGLWSPNTLPTRRRGRSQAKNASGSGTTTPLALGRTSGSVMNPDVESLFARPQCGRWSGYRGYAWISGKKRMRVRFNTTTDRTRNHPDACQLAIRMVFGRVANHSGRRGCFASAMAALLAFSSPSPSSEYQTKRRASIPPTASGQRMGL